MDQSEEEQIKNFFEQNLLISFIVRILYPAFQLNNLILLTFGVAQSQKHLRIAKPKIL